MRSSEISAVGVWGVSMSMRVRRALRARGALVSTPLVEIRCLPAAHGRARTRDLVPLENSMCLLENPTTNGIGWEWGAGRCAHSLWVSLCTLSPSLYYPAVRTTAATASRLAAAAAALPLAAERCLASLLTRRARPRWPVAAASASTAYP